MLRFELMQSVSAPKVSQSTNMNVRNNSPLYLAVSLLKTTQKNSEKFSRSFLFTYQLILILNIAKYRNYKYNLITNLFRKSEDN